jgi:murein DD-endopeptidase MepM/ murein hydrolase activator NlpD
MRWTIHMLAYVWLTAPALAQPLTLEGAFTQGGLVRGEVTPGSEVWFQGRKLRVSGAGRFVFGFGRDFVGPGRLEIRYADGRVDQRSIEVEKRAYQIQRIDGLPSRQVSPSEADLERIRADAELIDAARARESELLGFEEPIAWPAQGRTSGVFGSQRILNGEPRSPHKGLDIAAPPGTPVGSMAGGTVSLAQTDMYFTGGTVIVDHGHGLHSLYVHLQDVLVEPGQHLRQGEVLGNVGATGRATGPHLHWGVYWFGDAIDPALLVGPMTDG